MICYLYPHYQSKDEKELNAHSKLVSNKFRIVFSICFRFIYMYYNADNVSNKKKHYLKKGIHVHLPKQYGTLSFF